MNAHPLESSVPYGDPLAPVALSTRRLLSWPAIWAGWGAALALQVLFLLLGAGIGFAIYTPLKDANPAADLSEGAVVIQGVCAVVSLWIGGWVAGRFTPAGARVTGGLHGFLVWCVSTLAGVLVMTGGTGWAVNDLSKLVGGGLSMAAKPVAAATDQAGSGSPADALRQTREQLTSFTSEATASRPKDDTPGAAIRAKREIGHAVAQLFNPDRQGDQEQAKQNLIKALTANTSMSQEEATRTVDEWTASYQQLKQDLQEAKDRAAAKAREVANEAAKNLAIMCLVTFVAFAIGAMAATFGGKAGAKAALRRDPLLDASIA